MKISVMEIKLISFAIAIAPILDPYIIVFNLKIMDLFGIFMCCWLLCKNGVLKVHKPLLIFLSILIVCTLISITFPYGDRDIFIAIKCLIVWGIYILVLFTLWTRIDRELFITFSKLIAIFSATFLYVQFLFYLLRLQIPNGRIPGLEIDKYVYWSNTIDVTGILRLHSVFQEPSYLAIYTLPVLAQSIISKKYITSLYLAMALILSTSTLAVAGLVIIILWVLISTDKKMTIIFSLIGILVLHLILYNLMPSYHDLSDYTFNKLFKAPTDLTDERYGSSKLRILGYLPYFWDFPLFYKIFGDGANQFANYLSSFDVLSYSSTVVVNILDYGVVGFIALLYFFANILVKSEKGKSIFSLIFIMVCFVDWLWMNWRFFYLITFIILYSKPISSQKDNELKINKELFLTNKFGTSNLKL